MPSKKQRILFNLATLFFIVIIIGLISLLIFLYIEVFEAEKYVLGALIIAFSILPLCMLFYVLKEGLWLLWYLVKKPPYEYLRSEHIGTHEEILIEYLREKGEEPNIDLLRLAEMKKERGK